MLSENITLLIHLIKTNITINYIPTNPCRWMVGSSSKTAVALQHTLSCSVRTSSCPFVQAWKHHPCDVCFDPMRRSLRHKNKAPRIDLVSVSAIMDFVGMYSIRTSPLLTLSFMHEEIAMPNMTSTVTRALALSHQLHGGLVS